MKKLEEKIEWLINKACQYSEIDIEDIFLRTRKREIVDARKIVMYILMTDTNYNSIYIASIFDMHHASVFHALKCIPMLVDTDKNFAAFFKQLESDFITKFGRCAERSELLALDVVTYNENDDTIRKSISRALVCH